MKSEEGDRVTCNSYLTSTMKLKQILDQVPEIAQYKPQIPALRLQNEKNHITVENEVFEVRLFAFYVNSVQNHIAYANFQDYVQRNNLQDQELSISVPHKHFPILTFNRLDESVYIVLSLAAATAE